MSTSPYTVRLHAPLEREVVRVFRGQINSARRALRTPDDGSVHTARKSVKRSRAVLRLVQGALPVERFRELDRGLRTAGRRMGPVRDAAVALSMIQTMEGEGTLEASVASTLRAFLEDEHARAWDALNADEGSEGVRADLAALHLGHDEVAGVDVLTLHGGLMWTYGSGHGRFAEAVQRPHAETLHAWRRQVKHLGYHIRLLVKAWPLVLRPTVRAFDALSNALGDDHDLAELVRHARRAGLRKGALRAVTSVARTQRKALQETAWPLGARLYAEDRTRFAGRVTVYLATALAEQHQVPIHPLNGLAVPFSPIHPLASNFIPS